MRLRAVLGLAMLLPVAGWAVPPAEVDLTYELSRNGLALATIVEHLRHGGGRYELVETWQGRGLFALRGKIERSSRGLVTTQGLRPEAFEDVRTGRDTARASFDWSARTLTMQFREGPDTRPIPPHAQDRLSFLAAFAFLPPDTQTVRFSVADGGGVSTYIFDRIGSEKLSTPIGELDTVKIARRKDGPEDRRSTEIWLGIQQGLLPVRVLVTEKDGSQIDQRLTAFSIP